MSVLGVGICFGAQAFLTVGCRSHKAMVSASAVDSAVTIGSHSIRSVVSMDSLLQNECWTLHDVVIRVTPDSVSGTPGAVISIARVDGVRERRRSSRLQAVDSLDIAESVEMRRVEKSLLRETKSVESPLKWVWRAIGGVLCLVICVGCVKLFRRT